VRKSKMRWENLREEDKEDPYVLVNLLGLGPFLLMFVWRGAWRRFPRDVVGVWKKLDKIWRSRRISKVCVNTRNICSKEGRLYLCFFSSFDIDDCYALAFDFTFELYHIVDIYFLFFNKWSLNDSCNNKR
jgi:hypothetical protein